MKYKLIISDYDGTLSSSSVAPKEAKEAIDKYRTAGGKFVIVTGRATGSIENVIKNSDVTVDAYGSNQGAQIYVGNNNVHNGGIDSKICAKIVKVLHDFNRDVAVFNNTLNYQSTSERMQNYVYWYSKTVNVLKHDNLESFCLNYDGKFGRIVFQKTENEDVSKIVSILEEKFGNQIIINSGAPTICEIVSVTDNKYSASKFLANYFGVEESAVITMGDSTNDEMLLSFGFPIAVGNACEELKKQAKFIAPTIENCPIQKVVDKVLAGEDFN